MEFSFLLLYGTMDLLSQKSLWERNCQQAFQNASFSRNFITGMDMWRSASEQLLSLDYFLKIFSPMRRSNRQQTAAETCHLLEKPQPLAPFEQCLALGQPQAYFDLLRATLASFLFCLLPVKN